MKVKKIERFIMNLSDDDLHFVETLAKDKGVTMSWVYRSILFALKEKFSSKFPEHIDIVRPLKFTKPFRKITICMYGDKSKWMSLSRIWNVELGPLIRFGLKLFQQGFLELDFESSRTIKEVKISKRGKILTQKKSKKSNRCIHQYHSHTINYCKKDFWEKNIVNNRKLMDFGLSNRVYPLILS